MKNHTYKTQESKNKAVKSDVAQKKGAKDLNSKASDKRPEAIVQRKLQDIANNSPQTKKALQFQEIANSRFQTQKTLNSNNAKATVIQGFFYKGEDEQISPGTLAAIRRILPSRLQGNFDQKVGSKGGVDINHWLDSNGSTIATGKKTEIEALIAADTPVVEAEVDEHQAGRLRNLEHRIKSLATRAGEKDSSGHGAGKKISSGHSANRHQRGIERKRQHRGAKQDHLEEALQDFRDAGGAGADLGRDVEKALSKSGVSWRQHLEKSEGSDDDA